MSKVTIRSGKGQHHKGCIIYDNIDVQYGCCATGVQKDGSIDRNNFCSYCYASYLFQNNYGIKAPITSETFVKEIERREKEKTKESNTPKKITNIRLGKSYEIWDPQNPKESKETLISVLKACNENKLPFILITKLMPFDMDISNQVLKLNSTIHYSLGKNSLETGAVRLGMPEERRVEEAEKYFSQGCNIYLRVAYDVVEKPPKNIKDLRNKTKIPLLITPLRYHGKKLFEDEHPDLTWEEAKIGNYAWDRGGLRPQKIHPEWRPKTTAFCGVVADKLGCNSCGLFNGKMRWVKEK